MTALEGSENRIEIARNRYNEAVQDYNTDIRTFPDAIGAKLIHGAKPMVPFEATEAAQNAPSVNFGNMGSQPAAAPAMPGANDNTAQPSATATSATN